jgi:hypothetical protein
MNIVLLFAALIFFTSPIFSQDCVSDLDHKKLKRDNPKAYDAFLKQEKITEDYRNRMLGNG